MDELLGGRIKELRNAYGMTQEEVASRIGVSRQKYARIENGSNNITLDILSKIASVFDVNVNDITSVLDEEPSVAYRAVRDPGSANKVFEMLDLFYANKHLYTKIKRDKKREKSISGLSGKDCKTRSEDETGRCGIYI